MFQIIRKQWFLFAIIIAFASVIIDASGTLSQLGIIFMGSQKTLALSVILQVSVFPQYGTALLVCVLHHIFHLIIDGYLSTRLGDQPSDLNSKRCASGFLDRNPGF